MLSAVIIAKNEQQRIGDCIKSLAFADEVLLIDNASADATSQVASRLGATVVYTNERSFAKLREIGMRRANGEWILYVDADEIVPEKLAREIQNVMSLKELRSPYAAYRIKRKNYYFNRPWPGFDRLERLFRKKSLKGWYGPVHESPRVSGTIGDLEVPLLHYTHRSLTEMVAKTNEWSETEAALRFTSGHPRVVWWRFFRVMLTGFWSSYIRQGGWRVGTEGIIESIYQAFSLFITYVKLWEMQQQQ